jgi:hypothetical protein
VDEIARPSHWQTLSHNVVSSRPQTIKNIMHEEMALERA